MPKEGDLTYGPPGANAMHICVDMQRMFAEATHWMMPWLSRVLPNIVKITAANPERALFTRFIPARSSGQGVGMWRHYYERWSSMAIDELGLEMVDLVPDLARFVPPARTFDKYVYSPWTGSDLHARSVTPRSIRSSSPAARPTSAFWRPCWVRSTGDSASFS